MVLGKRLRQNLFSMYSTMERCPLDRIHIPRMNGVLQKCGPFHSAMCYTAVAVGVGGQYTKVSNKKSASFISMNLNMQTVWTYSLSEQPISRLAFFQSMNAIFNDKLHYNSHFVDIINSASKMSGFIQLPCLL